MSDPMIKIHNIHVPECGQPPTIDTRSFDGYVSYFQNRYSEQWIFTYERETQRIVIRGGDCGWDEEHVVTEDGEGLDVLMEPEELLWFQTALSAATGAPIVSGVEP